VTVYQAFYQTVRHYAGGNLDAAETAAQSIAGQGELYAQAARWLARVAQGGETRAYLDAEAFAAFIRGGGNVALYDAVETMIAAAWDAYRPSTVLDIGPGDGKVITGALRHTNLHPLPALDLVEPATNLLPKAQEHLSQHAPPLEVRSFKQTIQDFMSEVPPTAGWDLCQATWSLQNLPPTERATIFRWLRDRCTTLLVAEFDVQAEAYPLLSPERVRLIQDKYVAGIAEYTGQMAPALEERVKQGLLMPILFGYFRSNADRSTYEQPIARWASDIQAAGFGRVQRKLIHNYWWAEAYLLIAQA
jgi:hypothetical protein